MAIPLQYNLRNLATRRFTTGISIVGIAAAVFLYCVFSATMRGALQAEMGKAEPLNVMVYLTGSTTEWSQIYPEMVKTIRYLPGVRVGEDGRPLAVADHYCTVLWKDRAGEKKLVVVRGVEATVSQVYPSLKAVEGRLPKEGHEVAVGKILFDREGLKVGDVIDLGKHDWTVVGAFAGGSGNSDSEIWGPVEPVINSFQLSQLQPYYSSVTLRAEDEAGIQKIKEGIERDSRLNGVVTANSETEYYKQFLMVSMSMFVFLIIAAVIMGIGALFGAMNTLLTSIADRRREIATVRVIGFTRGSVIASFIVEMLVISLIGGVIGALASLSVNGATGSLLAVGFRLDVTPWLCVQGVVFALVIGVIGGLIPSLFSLRRTLAAELTGR